MHFEGNESSSVHAGLLNSTIDVMLRFKQFCGGLRHISTSGHLFKLLKKNELPPRPKWLIVEEEIKEVFLKGGRGPGGQKINKSNSKVQLTHIPTGTVVTCQYSRSQEQNRKKAREILALKLEELQNPQGCRTAVLRDRESKVKLNKAKKSSRKYRTIEEQRRLEQAIEDKENETLIDIEEEFESLREKLTKRL